MLLQPPGSVSFCFLLPQAALRTRPELPVAYRHSAWQAQELGPFIRLCLMDQHFPAFVEEVEKELQKLTEAWEIPAIPPGTCTLDHLHQLKSLNIWKSLTQVVGGFFLVSVLFLKTGESTFYTSLHFNKYTEHKFMHLQLRTSWEPLGLFLQSLNHEKLQCQTKECN